MKHYIGIDLGTTNSAISAYDGENLQVYKSPEQNLVTPSAIYVDRRGTRYYGAKAYNMVVNAPDNVAVKFKKLMGTSTPIQIPGANLSMTPEEASAEILKALFAYLPEEVRNDPDTGTVITVPAAFNQMQRDATMSAAELAAIGKVALMQEPVAAVMAAMRARRADGMFLIYDLGGGTFDIALAQALNGRVNLLAHGGIAMCGGSDFDRVIVDNVVKPWLAENFNLPDDFTVDKQYRKLIRVANHAAEQAKIALSFKPEVVISLNETEIRMQDLDGNEIYIAVPILRRDYDPLIRDRIMETIEATRDVLKETGVTHDSIDRIVFVGGPTNYEPTCKLVCFELGIAGDTKVDPMTAVAEGAALFAESIDWNSHARGRKSSRGSVAATGPLDLSFEYTARTPDLRAKIIVRAKGHLRPGSKFQVDSMDIGWSSGQMALSDGASLALTLAKNGENKFRIFVFDPSGGPIALENDVITITRTTATVDAIPASHSIGIQVKERIGSQKYVLDPMVKKGDHLPAKGVRTYKTETALRANGPGEITVALWEGEIRDPVTDNNLVGAVRITGEDFEMGVIESGTEILCEYEVLDSGKISITVTVPKVNITFTRDNFYVPDIGKHDFSKETDFVAFEIKRAMERLDELSGKITDNRIEQVRTKLNTAQQEVFAGAEPEVLKQAYENVLDAKRVMAKISQENFRSVREIDFDTVMRFFEQHARSTARPSEITAFDNAAKAAQRDIGERNGKFEQSYEAMRDLNWRILVRQDGFMVDMFNWLAAHTELFHDKQMFTNLVAKGREAIKADDIDTLRQVVGTLQSMRIPTESVEAIAAHAVNLVRGSN